MRPDVSKIVPITFNLFDTKPEDVPFFDDAQPEPESLRDCFCRRLGFTTGVFCFALGTFLYTNVATAIGSIFSSEH